MRPLALLALCVALAACTGGAYRDTAVPIAAQRDFQPERYLGRWYEIARFPVIFEQGCTATTADYGPIDAETVSVLNTCRKGAPDGPADEIAGTARIVAPGELKVKFAGVPFVAADYWVLWVDDGLPDRRRRRPLRPRRLDPRPHPRHRPRPPRRGRGRPRPQRLRPGPPLRRAAARALTDARRDAFR